MDALSPLRHEVQDLIELSEPRERVGFYRYGLGIFLLLILVKAYAATQWPEYRALVEGLASVAILAMISVLMFASWRVVRAARREQQSIQSIEELMQLRRWPEALTQAEGLLSEPTRGPATRVTALLYLSSILARYRRHHDAIVIQEAMLDEGQIDPGTAFGVKLGRAMSMLQEDRLVDADRAISELRRDAGGDESAGLGLVLMYRDVKTGHSTEALDLFDKPKTSFSRQLGHRSADAHALAAVAADALGFEDDAHRHYRNATLLGSETELHRRYSEVARLAGKYPAETRPGGAAPEALDANLAPTLQSPGVKS